ncbi:hypothetical protein [Novosphingobium sp.]|uniref:hypothetical protein n=1 Tax=Novosphingobium sp. TaxID=1874826 RepID=UPI002607A9E8|nr:hypothetical protein [Novosphingobium sp.]
MTPARFPRGAGLAGALALVLAPVTAQAAETAAVCPDAATVQAARLVEFQTMMMGVGVRCRHVGVPISDHLDGMNSSRRTMFAEANDRVASFLRSLPVKPAPGAARQVAAASPPAPAAPAKPAPVKTAPAKLAAGKSAPGKAAPGKAAPGRRTLASTSIAAKSAPGTARKALPNPAAAPPLAAKPAAKISRRTDPYDRYLTMIGNQYGGGITTLQRCKAFDAIVLSLADKTNTDRLLTMVSTSLVQVTLLEAIVNCPPGKK